MVAGFLLVGFLVGIQGGGQAPPECIPSGLSVAAMQLCFGEEEAKRAAASPEGSTERTGHLETAADHFRRASDVGTSVIITALARIYDEPYLNDPAQRETVLGELMVLVPTQTDLYRIFRSPPIAPLP